MPIRVAGSMDAASMESAQLVGCVVLNVAEAFSWVPGGGGAQTPEGRGR